jgi:hypothetical protein
MDTDVVSADVVPGAPLAERYAPIIAGRPAPISFHTAAHQLHQRGGTWLVAIARVLSMPCAPKVRIFSHSCRALQV